MDLKTMEWTILGIRSELETLQKQVAELTAELRSKPKVETVEKQTDELLNTKEVLNYLGICYNTLQSIIKKGFLSPIRINQRRVKFSKQAIIDYINERQVKLAE